MNIIKIVKSNLSSYGSSSLKQLQRISDHDISKIQKHSKILATEVVSVLIN